eukprot:979906_1
MSLKRSNSKETNRSSDSSASIDKSSYSSKRLVTSLDRRMGCKICGNSRRDNIVWSSDKNSHNGKHDKKSCCSKGLRVLREDSEEYHKSTHENSDNSGTTSSKPVRYNTYDDSARHHTDRVKSSNKVGSYGIKVLSKEVREPKEQNVVCKLEKTECKCVLSNHRNTESSGVRDRGGSRIVHIFSLGCFSSILLHANTDIVSNDTSINWVSNESDGEESPKKVGHSRDEKSPPVRISSIKNSCGTKSSSDISTVLMTSPASKNKSTTLDTFLVAEPVTHDGSSYRSSSTLEESKEEVDSKNEKVSKSLGKMDKIKPKRDIQKEKTHSRSK